MLRKLGSSSLQKGIGKTETEKEKVNRHGLRVKYTFESFVVGKGNELAKAAATAVVEKPGMVYNPLFIYGGVGLGKTHLMQSIGNSVIEKHPEKKVIYVTCEKFTNDFIRSVRGGNIEEFKNNYRTVDLLLIDDIQFIAGKEGTQEEFFHTFNALHQEDKQIVVTSDRPPKAIPALENRLTSRFEWGMIVDVGSPDLETRNAILEAKCLEKKYELDPQIIQLIAKSIQNNVRELEGALNKVIAYHQLNNTQPTGESVKSLLSSLSASPKKGALTPKQIISTVSEYYDIKTEDLTGGCRKKALVTPRQIIMYLMREELRSSYPAIGHELGGRDHTTAMHAYTKITKEVDDDERTRQDINLIRQKLYA